MTGTTDAERGRSSQVRKRAGAYFRQHRTPCHICGQPIDYSVPWPDPASPVVDHVVPISRGGPDTLENTRPAHAGCNRAKSNRADNGGVLKRSGSLRLPDGPGMAGVRRLASPPAPVAEDDAEPLG